MENKEPNNGAKVPENEHYDPENPQNHNLPIYRSDSEHREAGALPGVENLNQIKDEKYHPEQADKDDSTLSTPENDDSLFGKTIKTDLGGGQRDDDEDEKEKIIRT